MKKQEERAVYLTRASSEDASESELAYLAFNEEWQVRLEVARNPNTPLSVLEELSHDPIYRVRWEIAWNPNASEELHSHMLMSVGWQVRLDFARSTDDEEILAVLAHDPVWEVREKVAWNLHTPDAVLDELEQDQEYRVRESTMRRKYGFLL